MEKKIRNRTSTMTMVEKIIKEKLSDIYNNYEDKHLTILKTYETTISKKLVRIDDLSGQILDSYEEEEDIIREEEKMMEFTVYAENELLILREFITKHEKRGAGDDSRALSATSSSQQTMKLPKLNLEPFDGNPLNWRTFHDTFICCIHENDGLSEVERMSYLLSLVTGTAAETLKGLRLSNDNYKVALELLKDRFGDEQLLISTHMTKLLEMKPAKDIKDITRLRNLYDTIEGQIRSLSCLGLDAKNYGPLLIPVLMTKIPEEIKLIVSRKQGKDQWDIKEIIETIKEEVAAREKMCYQNSIHNETERKHRPNLTTGAALLNQGGKSVPLLCVYCNGDHKAQDCTGVSNVDQRKTILKNSGRCFLCLKTGHMSKNCYAKFVCFNCSKRHHVSICQPAKNVNTSSGVTSVDSSVTVMHDHNNILLQTATATVYSLDGKNSTQVRILFDSGSQLTYVSPEVRNRLNLKSDTKETLTVKVFGGSQSAQTLDFVQLYVKGVYGNENISIDGFVSEICKPVSGQSINLALQKYSHLQGLQLADENVHENEVKIDVLVGVNHYWKFFNNNIVRSKHGGPVAMGSMLGFVLSGPVEVENVLSSNVSISTHSMKVATETVQENEVFSKNVTNFWDLESLGVPPVEESVYEKFNREIKFVEGRYEVKLPLKESKNILNDNFQLSKTRLKSLVNRNKNSIDILRKCDDIFKEQEQVGVIEKVQNNNENICEGNVCYLPHRPVIRDQKTTSKVRVVFDCSAAMPGETSLNDCLLTPSLYSVLLKFRSYNTAFTSDIEKAFLQISINREYRDFLRFLWFSELNEINFDNFDENNFVTYRLCRVLFGATCSPFLLTGTLIHHMKQFEDLKPEFVQKFLQSLHVDDFIFGADNDSDAMRLYLDCKEALNKANFNLRKFNSNSVLLENMLNEKLSSSECDFDETEIKVLGVNWNKAEDGEICERAIFPPTKRNVLQCIASFYDPLGLVNPVIVKMKIFFQKLWVEKVDWDEQLKNESLEQWTEILNALKGSPIFSIPRLYCFKRSDNLFESVQIHGFSDASNNAYGAAIFIRAEYKSGDVKVSLVTAKSKVKPLSKTTIPRLELLAALLLSQLMKTVKNDLNTATFSVEKFFFWTDSSIVYSWIHSTKEFKTFVQNRVSQIRELSRYGTWKLIPSKQNPADIISRGCYPEFLCESELWVCGPQFLIKPETCWPQLSVGDSFVTETEEEINTNLISIGPTIPAILEVENYNTLNNVKLNTSLTGVESNVNLVSSGPIIPAILDVEKYNTLNKLVNVLAWILRYVSNLRKKEERRLDITKQNKNNTITTLDETCARSVLSGDEILRSFQLLLHDAQQQMTSNKDFKELKHCLNLFKDENNLFRCRGRLSNAPLPMETKYPLLLTRDCHLAKLIVLDAHSKVFHNGVNETLNFIRQMYWIPKGRSFVRKIIRQCYLCKLMEAKTLAYPNPPDLPKDRLQNDRVFSTIGIDHAGPVYVKDLYGDKKETFKAWIVLITCASSRAVYLDLAVTTSGKDCIKSLRKFIARYGAPNVIISDNGKGFISNETQEFAANKRITWKFNLEAAPWQGGFFERMVRSVKRCLKKILLNARLSFQDLTIILSEIEVVINNRPLTYIYNDDSNYVALTPNHLIYGRNILESATRSSIDETVDEQQANRRLRHTNTVLLHFWKRWSNEYLADLREQQKIKRKVKLVTPSVGDIVLLKDERRPRSTWNLARVDELIVSEDGVTRGANITTTTKQGRKSVLNRPINKLVPLELCIEKSSNETGLKFIDDRYVLTLDRSSGGV